MTDDKATDKPNRGSRPGNHTVMTVGGPVAPDELGVTLMHEHILLDMVREFRLVGLLNDVPLASDELMYFSNAGGRTVVDVTNASLGREPAALRTISERTGLHIVLGCGLYRQQYFDRDWVDRTSTDEIAAWIVRDLTEGINGTEVRAGIIGEIGCDEMMTAQEERSFRAAARAQLATGVAVSTHAARWPVGLPQLDLLESEGVDPQRVIIGHCDTVSSVSWEDPDDILFYHLELARRGAYVQFDTIRPTYEHEVKARIRYICHLLSEGHGAQILLGHDTARRPLLKTYGGGGYDYILTGFVPRLLEVGVSQKEITMMLVDNPRRALSGEQRSGSTS
jgi:phosphotriesterase-related protein